MDVTGLIRDLKTHEWANLTPSQIEMILEGFIYPNDRVPEGPFGDHTGYYNEVETFPVFTVEKITHRNNPIYHSTYTGKNLTTVIHANALSV